MQMNVKQRSAAIVLAGAALAAATAQASGLQPASTLDTSALFEPAQLYISAGQFGVMGGNIHLRDGQGVDRSGQPVTTGPTQTKLFRNYVYSYGVVKFRLGERVDCMLEDIPAAEADFNPGLAWVGRYQLASFQVESQQKDLTCSVAAAVGPGRFRLIGGYVRTDAEVDKTEAIAGPIYATLHLTGHSSAWRFGMAYEIPESGIRAVLMYQQDQPTALTGIPLAYVPNQVQPTAAGTYRINTALPRTIQLDLQSGIRPGWLAFTSFNWQRWSDLQNLPNASSDAVLPDSTPLYLRNALAVRAGVAHQWNDKLVLFSALTWMQGVAGHSNPASTQTAIPSNNTGGVILGGKYSISANMDVKFAFSASRMNGGSYLQVGPTGPQAQGGKFSGTWFYGENISLAVHF